MKRPIDDVFRVEQSKQVGQDEREPGEKQALIHRLSNVPVNVGMAKRKTRARHDKSGDILGRQS